MKRSCLPFIVCLVAISLASPVWSQEKPAEPAPKQAEKQEEKPAAKDPNPVVLRVGQEEIRASDAEALLESLPPQSRTYFRTVGRRQFADYLVTLKTLAAEGERRKLADEPATRLAIETCRQSLLADATRRDIESAIEVTPAEVERFYKEHEKDFEQVHVRHIRMRATSSVSVEPEPSRATPIPTDEEAEKKLEELHKRAEAGEDFADLARQFSDDLESAGLGGDAGWISHGQVPLDYAFALQPGQLSPVFRGPYGYELIKLEGRRIQPLEQVRARIEKVVRNQKTEDVVQKLRGSLNPVINEEYFKPINPGEHPDAVYWQFGPFPSKK